MLCEIFSEWMVKADRSPKFLSERSGIGVARLIALAHGRAQPTVEELSALSEVMGVPADELRDAAATARAWDEAAQREWLSVAEAAGYIGCSTDTVRAMIRDGKLAYSQPGERLTRISRTAIDGMLERCTRRGPSTSEARPEVAETGPPPRPGRLL